MPNIGLLDLRIKYAREKYFDRALAFVAGAIYPIFMSNTKTNTKKIVAAEYRTLCMFGHEIDELFSAFERGEKLEMSEDLEALIEKKGWIDASDTEASPIEQVLVNFQFESMRLFDILHPKAGGKGFVIHREA